jgi:anaerobic selenocysteine-containing dehydrogenase
VADHGAIVRRATACRICAAGCGTLVDIDGDRVLRVSGDPDDPWSRGYTCSKGRAGPDFHHRLDRFDTPLIRRDGEFGPASWDIALDDIAGRLAEVRDAYGPQAIAHYVGTGGPLDPTGYAMAHGFFRALGTDRHFSALSIDCSGKQLVPQLVSGVQLMFQPDLDRASLLLALGVNTVVSHGHGLMVADPLTRLRGLRARGGRLVVVDPRRSETAHHADLHVPLRPGTDPALLGHLIRTVLSTGGDIEYLATCVQPASLERLRRAVDRFDVATTASICGVSDDVIHRLDTMVREAGRVAVETGTGTTMNRTANVTEWLVWALSAVTGSLDRSGGATFNPGFLRRLEDALPAGRGDMAPRASSRPDAPRIVNGELPCAVLADEIESGSLHALVVRLGNPALAIPGNERLRRALSGLGLLVALDVVPTETTRLATHILPMTDHFERADLVTGYLQAAPFLRFAPAVVEPLGQRRPQWWVFAELSRRLGLPLFGSSRRDEALAGRSLDDEVIAASVAGQARRSWSEVRAAPYGVLDDSIGPGWLIPDRLPGLLDVAPNELVAQLDGWSSNGRPDVHSLVMINRRTAARYNSFAIKASTATLLIHPDDAARLGLRDGDTTVITTATGSCRAVVEVNETIRRGVVSLPHGFGDADVNRLTTSDTVDPLNAMPVMSGYEVGLSGPVA